MRAAYDVTAQPPTRGGRGAFTIKRGPFMKTFTVSALALAGALALAAPAAQAVVIDFTGGVVTLADGSTTTTNNSVVHNGVATYEEDGILVSFDGAPNGIIGDYYSMGAGGFVGNDVIHAHWDAGITSITFTKVDGKAFDLTYFDLTSNTTTGGGQASGLEDSWITASNGTSLKLPSSDWGFAKDYFGADGDGIARMYMGPSFLGITSFTITSKNAYCFGMDNFYIDQAAPAVPEPTTTAMVLAGLGLAGFAAKRRKA